MVFDLDLNPSQLLFFFLSNVMSCCLLVIMCEWLWFARDLFVVLLETKNQTPLSNMFSNKLNLNIEHKNKT